MIDAPDLAQFVVLGELVAAGRVVDAVGLAAATLDHREAWHIARTIGRVDHVLERDPAILRSDLGIYVQRGVLVGAFVDLEKRARLDRVVDDRADLADLGGRLDRELALGQESRRQRAFDEFATPDPVHERRDAAAADHLRQPGADDVVLEREVVLHVFRPGTHEVPQGAEEVRQPLVEGDLAAAFAQRGIAQSLHGPVPHVGQQVVEVGALPGDGVAALPVALRQAVDLGPETLLVHVKPPEEGGLHVARDQSLVKIPDAGDDVLREQNRGHGRDPPLGPLRVAARGRWKAPQDAGSGS